jgi:hypothetical protein
MAEVRQLGRLFGHCLCQLHANNNPSCPLQAVLGPSPLNAVYAVLLHTWQPSGCHVAELHAFTRVSTASSLSCFATGSQ